MQYELQDNQRFFNDFVSRQHIGDPHYLRVDLDLLRQHNPQTAQDLIKNPSKYYKLGKAILERQLNGDQKARYQSKLEHYRISFEGNLGANFVTPRGLGSKMANQLVGVQGIITKMDIVKHQLEKSVHFCEKTGDYDVKEYPDNFNPEKDFEPSKTRFIKTHDQNKNPLTFEYGMSSFRNIQNVVIQELPQMAPPGLLPQSVSVILQNDLVNTVKPGDRVQMIGIYKLIGGAQSKERGIFKPYFLCLSVKQLSQTINMGPLPSKIPFNEDQVVGICTRSVAPSIFGHQQLKKAVLLMLLGGQQKNLENGTHLRGDINLLMVGDPGTAKSQILRWVLSTAQLAIGTTGSGASGVGLTAAIVTDKDTGQKTLQAGAMVLADRGVVCIDQFDKMNEVDRVAVHEVMEQQTVTIAKAGMHCSLNARCSVIAAANPIYGEYQTNQAPTKNIGMQDSLLSRFDLIFIVCDQRKQQKDKKIAQRVCRNHRLAPKVNESYNQFNQGDDYIIHPNENVARQEQIIFQKNNIYQSDSKSKEILTQGFLRRYISHCKHNIHPQLTTSTIQLLARMWTLLRHQDLNDRSNNSNKVLPITIRSYQTLIRLSTAHAKLHQSSQIKVKDCIQAFRLMNYCLFGNSRELDQRISEICREIGVQQPKDEENDKSERVNDKSERSHTVQAPKALRPGQKPSDRKGKDRKMQEDGAGLIQKMNKVNINEEENEVERVIKEAMMSKEPVEVTKEMKSIVFKACSELNKKTRGGAFSFMDIRRMIPVESLSDEQIGETLKVLDDGSAVHYDAASGKVYL